jgi:hypothetical protein
MPVHAHDAAEGLKPEGIAQPGQKGVMPVMQKNAFNDGSSQPRHTLGQPGRDVAAMKGRIGKSGSLHNSLSHSYFALSLAGTPRRKRGVSYYSPTQTGILAIPNKQLSKSVHSLMRKYHGSSLSV